MTKILSNKSSVDLDYPICRPSLDLDFTQEVLDPRITFSRGSIGTRVNRNRLIETVSANTPRFDYDPVTGECKGLLIEESRQNIVLDSITLSSHTNASTTKNSTTETVSPDGTSNAYKIVGNYGIRTRQSIYSNSFTMNANSSYTASVFLKGTATRRYVVIWFDNTGPGNAPTEGPYYGSSVFIDLLTGTNSNPSIIKMVPYGNGWYRCYVTATVGASNLTNVFFNVSIGSPNGFSDTGNPSIYKYVGDGTSGIYYWGPQVEAGAFPTSYIPTSGSTVTRSADLADMRGSNFSSWYNSSEGTIYMNAIPYYSSAVTGFNRLISINDNSGTQNNVIQVGTQNTINWISALVYRSSVFQNGTNKVVLSGTKFKLAFGFTTNYFSGVYDGSIIPISRRILILSTFDRMSIGSYNGVSSYMTMHLSRLTYYPKKLKDNQLLYLTQ